MQRTTKYYIRIANWDELQHYKTRHAPWVKLYRDNLQAPWWVQSTDATRALGMALMMLAPSTNNRIPLDLDYVQKIACLHQAPDIAALVATGFAEVVNEAGEAVSWPPDASSTLAPCKHDASNRLASTSPEDASNLLEREGEKSESESIKGPPGNSDESPARTFASASPPRGESTTETFDLTAMQLVEARLKRKLPVTPQLLAQYQKYMVSKYEAGAATN